MNFGKTVTITGEDLPNVASATSAEFVSASETDFLDRLKSGDSTAFDILINRYSGDIYSLLFRLTQNHEEARDLAQETFLRVVQSVKSFRGDASLKTWLFRIAINQARNRRRWWMARRQNATFSLDAERSEDDSTSLHDTLADNSQATPEDEILRREQSERLHQALKELTPNFREAVVLRDIEEFSYEEIADALQTSVGTVKSRIARGREELRKKLKRSL
ncbi:MAG: sigma-70 family RNA polymerase sigma factor [Pyrinomonadaceae bacterium]